MFVAETKYHDRKVDPKLASKTWVHMLFGGLLRSRVKCLSCGHDSDTFDSILDLSIDIHGQASLKEALKKFTAVDHLRGADKYKCEKYIFMSSSVLSIFIDLHAYLDARNP